MATFAIARLFSGFIVCRANEYIGNMIRKIVIIGPESTGKSTLSSELAAHYETSWVPEFAREYLHKNGIAYEYDDLLKIAKGQLSLEDEQAQALEDHALEFLEEGGQLPLFIDTDMYVMKVWSEFVFGKCDPFILQQIVERKYDLYLLCNTDLPWEQDDLREYPDLETRYKLFLTYKDLLVNQSVPWVEIAGQGPERLRAAIAAVDGLLG